MTYFQYYLGNSLGQMSFISETVSSDNFIPLYSEFIS